MPSGSEHHRIGPCQQEWIAREIPTAKPLKFFFHHEPAYGVLSHGATHPNCDDGPCTMDANKPERNRYIELIADQATMLFCGHEHHFTVRKIDENFANRSINGSPALDFGSISGCQLTDHADHIGQSVLLARHLSGSRWKSLSIARGKSEEFNASPKQYLDPQ